MAFTPVRTLSGAMFPIKTGVTSAATIALGDLVMPDGGGKWKVGLATTGGRGLLGVAISAASAADKTFDICLATPDVLFKTTKTGTTTTLYEGDMVALNVSGMNIADAAVLTEDSLPRAFIYAKNQPTTGDYLIFLVPGFKGTTT